MKVCRICKCNLELNVNWHLSFSKGGHYICIPCESLRKLKYKKPPKPRKIRKTKKETNFSKRLVNFSIKELIIKKYGSKCECCGESRWQFLTIDHINNDGAAHRKIVKRKGVQFYKWLRNNNYPKFNFRLLCSNCNSTLGHHGMCPHTLSKIGINCCICNELLENNRFQFNIKNNNDICTFCIMEKAIKKRTHKLPKIIINNDKRKILAAHSKEDSFNVKRKVIEGYGSKCECCQETDYYFLTIDHINGGGTKERANGKLVGISFYRFLIKNNYPKDNYRLLCYNCNSCIGAYGQCYHQLCNANNVEYISIDEYKAFLKNGHYNDSQKI